MSQRLRDDMLLPFVESVGIHYQRLFAVRVELDTRRASIQCTCYLRRILATARRIKRDMQIRQRVAPYKWKDFLNLKIHTILL